MSEPEQQKSTDVDQASFEMHEEVVSAVPGSLGAQLASKREQLGWSVADVASHLKLAPRQIDAMEADNYAALPTMVMTRGFIRSYAKLLGLDAVALLATISPAGVAQPVATVAHTQLSTPFSESPFSLMGRSKFAYKWLVVLAVLLLLLALAIRFEAFPVLRNALQALTEKPAALATATATTSEEASAGSPATSETQAADAAANAALTAPPVAAANDASANDAGVNGTVAGAAAAGTVAVNEAINEGAANAGTGKAGAAEGLSLNFRQDSWVEIKRADNTMLISRLVKAGSTETVDMAQPVSVVIGNLAGVDATLRGAPLDLKAGSKTNVARLNLK